MEFVGIRVIKADVVSFNNRLGAGQFSLTDISMFRDGQWGACIVCPLFIHSIELMRIMDRLREFSCHYFMSADAHHIYILIQ